MTASIGTIVAVGLLALGLAVACGGELEDPETGTESSSVQSGQGGTNSQGAAQSGQSGVNAQGPGCACQVGYEKCACKDDPSQTQGQQSAGGQQAAGGQQSAGGQQAAGGQASGGQASGGQASGSQQMDGCCCCSIVP